MNPDYSTKTIKFAGIVLVLFASLLVPQRASMAQEPAPSAPKSPTEVQQLKDRLQQLEDTVNQLKSQLELIESSKPKTGIAEGEKISAPSEVPTTTTATATAPKPADANGESSFSVYGFVMLDAGYQF